MQFGKFSSPRFFRFIVEKPALEEKPQQRVEEGTARVISLIEPSIIAEKQSCVDLIRFGQMLFNLLDNG